jgi:hypothetical protein
VAAVLKEIKNIVHAFAVDPAVKVGMTRPFSLPGSLPIDNFSG